MGGWLKKPSWNSGLQFVHIAFSKILIWGSAAQTFVFCRFLGTYDFEGLRNRAKYKLVIMAQTCGDCEQLRKKNLEFLVMNEHHICIRRSAFGWSYRGVPPVSTEDSRSRHTNWYLFFHERKPERIILSGFFFVYGQTEFVYAHTRNLIRGMIKTLLFLRKNEIYVFNGGCRRRALNKHRAFRAIRIGWKTGIKLNW